jgi:hypothetical protein
VRVLLAALILVTGLGGLGAPAAAVGPTDIARVDEYIDAPRALFGRTRDEVERRLGTPTDVRPATGAGTVRLSWPGLDVAVSRSARVAAVVVRAAGRPLPYGLDVGAPRARVEAVLGEAQDMTDERYFYLDADGFPNTVEFFFRDGRVTRIEWRFWTE